MDELIKLANEISGLTAAGFAVFVFLLGALPPPKNLWMFSHYHREAKKEWEDRLAQMKAERDQVIADNREKDRVLLQFVETNEQLVRRHR